MFFVCRQKKVGHRNDRKNRVGTDSGRESPFGWPSRAVWTGGNNPLRLPERRIQWHNIVGGLSSSLVVWWELVLTLRRLIILAQIIGLTGFSAGCFTPSAPAEGAAKCVTEADEESLGDQVLQLVNLERAGVGLAPVVKSEVLSKFAGDYACRMIEGGFFGHTDPDSGYGPGERAAAGDYLFWSVGENLAAGQPTAADVMRVWMDSDSHRANILDDRWTEIGVGVRTGGEHSIYWVQEFGDPAGQ